MVSHGRAHRAGRVDDMAAPRPPFAQRKAARAAVALAVRSKGVGIQLHKHLRLLNLSSFQARLSRIGSGAPFLSRPERVEIDNGLPNACARAAGCPKAGPREREDVSAEPTWGRSR